MPKIYQIGQSAAELLQDANLAGEGSEAMHVASVTGNAVEEEMVQTATLKDD